MELLIKNIRVVDYSKDFIGDVYIKDGIISEIGNDILKDCEIIQGEGNTLLPSFIDTHAHFRVPGYGYKEDMETGSKAAVRGGYTAVNLMANTNPVCSDMEVVKEVMEKNKQLGLIDVHQAVSITRDFNGEDISHIDNLLEEVRLISEDGKDVLDSKVMLKAMEKAKKKGLIVMAHSEHEEIVKIDTRLSENMMSWRNVALAKFTNCKLHLAHVSTKEAMEYVIEAKESGYEITCEVTPHHIALIGEEVNYNVNPPLREKEDVKFLIEAIKNGYVDAIGTDHAPHSIEDKAKGAPGISGIETAFPVCYTKLVKEKHISLNKLSEIMSKNPAEILGFNKGRIDIGFDGDLVIVDLEKEYKIETEKFQSKGKNTPFQGMMVTGEVIKTIKAGGKVYDNR